MADGPNNNNPNHNNPNHHNNNPHHDAPPPPLVPALLLPQPINLAGLMQLNVRDLPIHEVAALFGMGPTMVRAARSLAAAR